MKFGVMGISHQEAALEKREAASFSDTQKLQLYDRILNEDIHQAMILTTCNRSELYFLYDHEAQIDKIATIFTDMTGSLTADDLYFRQEDQALLYLFEVCGGYHSMVPGEDQILNQMRQAYEFSVAAGACQKELHKIMQTCFACIRQIKHTYKISEISTSVGYLAYQYIKSQNAVGKLKVLIIGSGEMAQLMLTYLKNDPFQIYLCSRRRCHAEHLTDNQGDLIIIPFQERYQVAKDCDVIISATASPHLILTKDHYPHTAKEQYLLDLASPRDIDERLHQGNCHVCNLDDLQQIVDEHWKERLCRMEQAHHEMEETVENLRVWLRKEPIASAILSLQKRSEMQAQHTFALLQKKLYLAPHEERMVKKILDASFLRMVKEPILALKQVEAEDQSAYLEMMKTLFQLEDETHAIYHRNEG